MAIHATAVATSGRALLIIGPSRSGKSTLAAALIAASCRAQRVELVGDDRLVLTLRCNGEIVVRPHPRIAGFIERRGLGLVAVAHRASAVAVGVVDLTAATRRQAPPYGLPTLALDRFLDLDRRRDLVHAWWPTICAAAVRTHPTEKTALAVMNGAKHCSW